MSDDICLKILYIKEDRIILEDKDNVLNDVKAIKDFQLVYKNDK